MLCDVAKKHGMTPRQDGSGMVASVDVFHIHYIGSTYGAIKENINAFGFLHYRKPV